MENQQSPILLKFISFHFLFPNLRHLFRQYLKEPQVLDLQYFQFSLEQLIINLVLFVIQFKPEELLNEQFQFFCLFQAQPNANALLQVSFHLKTIYLLFNFSQFRLIHHNLDQQIPIFHFFDYLEVLLLPLQMVFYFLKLSPLYLLYQFFPHQLTLNYTPLYYLFHSFQGLFFMNLILLWRELLQHFHQLQEVQNKQTQLNHLSLIIYLNFLIILIIFSLMWKL